MRSRPQLTTVVLGRESKILSVLARELLPTRSSNVSILEPLSAFHLANNLKTPPNIAAYKIGKMVCPNLATSNKRRFKEVVEILPSVALVIDGSGPNFVFSPRKVLSTEAHTIANSRNLAAPKAKVMYIMISDLLLQSIPPKAIASLGHPTGASVKVLWFTRIWVLENESAKDSPASFLVAVPWGVSASKLPNNKSRLPEGRGENEAIKGERLARRVLFAGFLLIELSVGGFVRRDTSL